MLVRIFIYRAMVIKVSVFTEILSKNGRRYAVGTKHIISRLISTKICFTVKFVCFVMIKESTRKRSQRGNLLILHTIPYI